MKNKEHLTTEGVQKIVLIKAKMNLGLSDELKIVFPGVVAIKRPSVKDQKILNPYWLAGFASGEGCFMVNIQNSSRNRLGFQV